MKRILLTALLASMSASFINAQCNSANHDWGAAEFGVSPDPTIGENFLPAYINEPYSEVVYVLCPNTAADIDSTFPTWLMIDSVSLDSITMLNGSMSVQVSNLGLNVTCNNNGDSPNPCMFMPGEAYCGDITGIPNTVGSFPVEIWVTAYFVLGVPQEYPTSFTGYVLTVNGPASTNEVPGYEFIVKQNAPNPANDRTTFTYQLDNRSDVRFTVTNLLGKVVADKKLTGKSGENIFQFETSDLESGIYLYSFQSGDKKFTRKMIVQH